MMADRPYYTRLALRGLALYMVSIVIFTFAAIVGTIGDLGFVIPFMLVPGLISGAAIIYWKPWGLIVATLLGIFGLLFFAAGNSLSFVSPQAFFDFAGILFMTFGLLIMVIGCIVSLVQHFRSTPRMDDNPTFSKAVTGIAGVISVLAVISLVITIGGIGGVSAADEEGAEIVIAKKTKFDRDTIEVKTDGKVVFKNKDGFLHTFTVDEINIDSKVGPRGEKLITFKDAKPGTYEYYCKVTGHEEDMSGTLTIR